MISERRRLQCFHYGSLSMPRFVRVHRLEKMKHEDRLQRRKDLYRQRKDRETEEERQGEVHAYVLSYMQLTE